MATENESVEQQVLVVAQNLVNAFAGLDQETAERATRAAFIVKGWARVGVPNGDEVVAPTNGAPNQDQSAVAFFSRFEKLKPPENAQLCAAFHYSQHGNHPFSMDEIREIGKDAGLVLPGRVDMTFKQAGKSGRKLFQGAGKGAFKFTSHGEVYTQDRWGVRPGRQPKARRDGK